MPPHSSSPSHSHSPPHSPSTMDIDAASHFSEDAEDLIRTIGQNPLLKPVQDALHAQLLLRRDALSAHIRDQHHLLKTAQAERQQIGVTLYGLQQKLAQMQLSLEALHTRAAACAEERAACEGSTVDLRKSVDEKSARLRADRERLRESREQVNALRETLQEVERFNAATRGEILVQRRATYKAEESVGELERRKMRQDEEIEAMLRGRKRMEEDVEVVAAQVEAQRKETAAAEETLKEAAEGMVGVEAERKALLGKWKSVLVSIEKRDEALAAMRKSVGEVGEEEEAVKAEIRGTKRRTVEEQGKNEQLMEIKVRIERAMKAVAEQLKANQRENARLTSQYAVAKKSLVKAEEEYKKVAVEYKPLATQRNELIKKREVLARQRQEMEIEADELIADKTTSNEATRNLMREAAKLHRLLHSQEAEIAKLENALARARVEKLQEKAEGDELEKQYEALMEEIEEKERMVEKYNLESRQRTDEIEKKMHMLDRLNRKYEQLTAGDEEEEHLGPLEATIKNLGKQTTIVKDENQELERRWLRMQTEIVKVSSQTDGIRSKMRELVSKETILQQKRLRLDKEIEVDEVEIAKMTKAHAEMDHTMQKLSTVKAQTEAKRGEIQNKCVVMEREFIEELKEEEEASTTIQARIDQAEEAQQQNLEAMVDAERQIQLWEKKIQLAKEMQEAYDPSAGKSEIQMKQKEANRLRVVDEQLGREIAKAVKEIEQATLKRASIETRHKGKKRPDMKDLKNLQDQDINKAQLKKLMRQGANDLVKMKRELEEVNARIHAFVVATSEN